MFLTLLCVCPVWLNHKLSGAVLAYWSVFFAVPRPLWSRFWWIFTHYWSHRKGGLEGGLRRTSNPSPCSVKSSFASSIWSRCSSNLRLKTWGTNLHTQLRGIVLKTSKTPFHFTRKLRGWGHCYCRAKRTSSSSLKYVNSKQVIEDNEDTNLYMALQHGCSQPQTQMLIAQWILQKRKIFWGLAFPLRWKQCGSFHNLF